ncbi:hypothetical protein [Thauera sp. SDU_THAU2]|uniref:hypothetical protein n=1 Tax=Thauera sp. SDU_THAU2 TaxID=3136633 RepID=UPI0031200840
MESLEWLSGRHWVHETTAAPRLRHAWRQTRREHPRADQNRELTLIAVRYDITDNDYDYEGSVGSTASRFHVDVEAIPDLPVIFGPGIS